MDSTRLNRLNKILDTVCRGQTPISKTNYLQFLESIYSQPSAVACLSKLLFSSHGFPSLATAIMFDISLPFLNGHIGNLLEFFQHPDVAAIGGGSSLANMVKHLVNPPFFWSSIVQAQINGDLHEKAQKGVAWLLLQTIGMPEDDLCRTAIDEKALVEYLVSSLYNEVKAIGEKAQYILRASGGDAIAQAKNGPGGRHNNDRVDYRQIAILPTSDEISCTEPPFLRTVSVLEEAMTGANADDSYLDNMYRMLREDMLHDLREELLIVSKKQGGKPQRAVIIHGLKLLNLYFGDPSKKRQCRWSVQLQCAKDLPVLERYKKEKERKDYFEQHRRLFKDRALVTLLVDDHFFAFATIHRDEDFLAKKPPILALELALSDNAASRSALTKLMSASSISMVQMDTALFAYEPILRALQTLQTVPLSPEILHWSSTSTLYDLEVPSSLAPIVSHLRLTPSSDLRSVLDLSKLVLLDSSQASSLLSGLTQRVSLIQGPPGTGKSFIGALLAKCLHDVTESTILVVCYTNHALDQFLEELLDIGIPPETMLRLGSKSTARTEPLNLHRKRMGQIDYKHLDLLRNEATVLERSCQVNFDSCHSTTVGDDEIMLELEFNEEYSDFFMAFQVPAQEDGMSQVGKKGRRVDPNFLLRQWSTNKGPSFLSQAKNVLDSPQIWNMSAKARRDLRSQWEQECKKAQIGDLTNSCQQYNGCQDRIAKKYEERTIGVIKKMRIVACTTTMAAIHCESLRAAPPDVVLVEEAGEILESHVLTALGQNTQRLILIGDHKQLRPKINNHLLSVEKGEGYDLNRSLFERLAIKGYPHQTLNQQHRMRPELSELVRELTYPDLVDAPSTQNRPALRGTQSNIIFLNHDSLEDDNRSIGDNREFGWKSSKQNTYEVDMVMKVVRYLRQQEYPVEDLVVLTPYLGQLQKLQSAMKTHGGAVLNDLDSNELVKAGLLTPQSQSPDHAKRLRLATIDNYQGEESPIVIISLTRGNASNDIGFMCSPERVNVLLSRARNGLIIIGNSHTFTHSRRGGETWTKLLDFMRTRGQVNDGFPVQCIRHPHRSSLLKTPNDFEVECPNGGCNELCALKLPCNIHTCPSKCHPHSEHSKMKCQHVIAHSCHFGHDQSYKCFQAVPDKCAECEKQINRQQNKLRRDMEAKDRQEKDRIAYERNLADIDEKIARETEAQADARLKGERIAALEGKKRDLEAARRQTKSMNSRADASASDSRTTPRQPRSASLTHSTSTPSASQDPKSAPPSTTPQRRPSAPDGSPEVEWERRKRVDGVDDPAMDSVMEMIGLRDVKEKMLAILDKIELSRRQNTCLKGERFNISFLGNPGTGKTTVARLYAKFLTGQGVLSGSMFEEVTGASLANDGVAGTKTLLEKVKNAGGGAIFIDEAYQLVSGGSFGGPVLDFLLAEMENNVGTLVFILAGYNKQMDKFFEHNPGIPSRVPNQIQFTDYSDDELRLMLEKKIKNKYRDQMHLEDDYSGLYMRIAVRRLGRGRGREGFGNARALENLFSHISDRQAKRIALERKSGGQPNDFWISKEDLIGPNPVNALSQSSAMQELQKMIGLESVKSSVSMMFDSIGKNYRRELSEKEPYQVSLNRVFLGSPGTGKTTVAKLYGQILADLGLLSNGEVLVKNPSDFIGSALGQSEENTRNILANSAGKVLIIDEAYMLYGGGGSGGSQGDPYKDAVIDTLVAEVQSTPGEDRCVLLLGYDEQMKEMFQKVNPGLSRRFAIENAFHFEDFSDDELLEILDLKLKKQDLTATPDAKKVAIDLLGRLRNRPNFGNGGEVENVLGKAKANYIRRSPPDDAPLEARDFDLEFDRHLSAAASLDALFADVIGCTEIIEKLRYYQKLAKALKQSNRPTSGVIPMNFIFKGPPGTGKTTVARKIGQVYYDMGFLSSPSLVKECSASDLVGQYVGHTGPKTKALFNEALGGILFIDEAYRLAEGHFAQEAMDEIVGLLTQEKYMDKIVVILAGYDHDMNRLMGVNSGLSSRFPEQFQFEHFSPQRCLQILRQRLEKEGIMLPCLVDETSVEYAQLIDIIEDLQALESWGNARDMVTLSKQMYGLAWTRLADGPEGAVPTLNERETVEIVKRMYDDRKGRMNTSKARSALSDLPPTLPSPSPQVPPHKFVTNTVSKTKTEVAPSGDRLATPEDDEPQSFEGVRDAGVSDAVWDQLQIDKRSAIQAKQRAGKELREIQEKLQEAQMLATKAYQQIAAERIAVEQARDEALRLEAQRRLEEALAQEAAAKLERERLAKLAKEKAERLAREREEEMKMQQRLRQLGACPAGFAWIKQAGGYRCAGGSHWLSEGRVGF